VVSRHLEFAGSATSAVVEQQQADMFAGDVFHLEGIVARDRVRIAREEHRMEAAVDHNISDRMGLKDACVRASCLMIVSVCGVVVAMDGNV
jgi:hypothetical protein